MSIYIRYTSRKKTTRHWSYLDVDFHLLETLSLLLSLWFSSPRQLITGWAVAQPMRKVGFSATPGSKTPEGIATKFGVHNYVGDPILTSKYGSDRAACVFRRMREISLAVVDDLCLRVLCSIATMSCSVVLVSQRYSLCTDGLGARRQQRLY